MVQARPRNGAIDLALERNRRGERFLFVTLGHIEADFYGRVGAQLRALGHEVAHVTFSRRAAQVLERKGFTSWCMPALMEGVGDFDQETEARRIAAVYDTPTFRDIYRTDFVCDGRDEEWCVDRTIRHVLAMERVFETFQPTVLVPEVGNETIRTAAHLVALRREVPTLFLFYTIFPRPLRLYLDRMHAPIVSPDELRPLAPKEAAEVERFVADFLARDEPIRAYRVSSINSSRLRIFARHLLVKTFVDRDNDYLIPLHWALGNVREIVRKHAAGHYYVRRRPDRPYVYFPLHLVDDYKLKRLIPHCADQLGIIEQVARSLPHGWDLVVKEHPMSIGRNKLSMLRRLRHMRNVRIVEPHTSTHDLIEQSRAVAVISSTVGLEALLHGKPVLTIGRPFYAGYGITLDLDGPADLREAVPELLRFAPDRERIHRFVHAAMRHCYPGAPVLVDRSDANARALAGSLSEVAGADLGELRTAAGPDAPGALPARA